MHKPIVFLQTARKNVAAWEDSGANLTNIKDMGGALATYLFYIGDIKRAQEVSYAYSLYQEGKIERRKNEAGRFKLLFYSALYRGLADREDEATCIWQDFISRWSPQLEENILLRRRGGLWVMKAYALIKVGRYNEVREAARTGLEYLNQGMGLYKIPCRNTLEYGLVAVVQSLANYKLDSLSTSRSEVQQTLVTYKKENVQYGRTGYPVIFDLQLSHPAIFDLILPDFDPEKD